MTPRQINFQTNLYLIFVFSDLIFSFHGISLRHARSQGGGGSTGSIEPPLPVDRTPPPPVDRTHQIEPLDEPQRVFIMFMPVARGVRLVRLIEPPKPVPKVLFLNLHACHCM